MTANLHASQKTPVVLNQHAGSIIEMHAHSSNKSLDSAANARDLVSTASKMGLNAICLTEHNALWSLQETAELSELFEINVFPAMELGTNAGHILAYGFDRYRPQFLMFDELVKIASDEPVALVVAHPMRSTGTKRRPSRCEIKRWFHGVEVVNGDHSDSDDGYYVRLAEELGVSAIGGSDAHTLQAVGRVVTVFDDQIDDIDSLVSAIVNRNLKPLDLRVS